MPLSESLLLHFTETVIPRDAHDCRVWESLLMRSAQFPQVLDHRTHLLPDTSPEPSQGTTAATPYEEERVGEGCFHPNPALCPLGAFGVFFGGGGW